MFHMFQTRCSSGMRSPSRVHSSGVPQKVDPFLLCTTINTSHRSTRLLFLQLNRGEPRLNVSVNHFADCDSIASGNVAGCIFRQEDKPIYKKLRCFLFILFIYFFFCVLLILLIFTSGFHSLSFESHHFL